MLLYPWEYDQPQWETKMYHNHDELFGRYGVFGENGKLSEMNIDEEKFRKLMELLVEYKMVDDRPINLSDAI